MYNYVKITNFKEVRGMDEADMMEEALEELIPEEDVKVPFCKTKVFKAIVASVAAAAVVGMVVAIIVKCCNKNADDEIKISLD